MRKQKAKQIGSDVDYELACSVSKRVNLIDVRLEKSECFQKPNRAKSIIDIDIECEVGFHANPESNVLVVVPQFIINGYLDEKKDEADFNINATFVLIYRIDSWDGLESSNFDAFANSNGVYNAWPYWREYVQNITSRMGLPPLTIPVFRLSNPSPERKQSEPVARQKVMGDLKTSTSKKKSKKAVHSRKQL